MKKWRRQGCGGGARFTAWCGAVGGGSCGGRAVGTGRTVCDEGAVAEGY